MTYLSLLVMTLHVAAGWEEDMMLPPLLEGFQPRNSMPDNLPLMAVRDPDALEPVILLPALTGSVVEARLNKNKVPHVFCYKTAPWYVLWFGATAAAPGALDCFLDNIRLEFDEPSSTVHNPQGVTTRIPDYGGTAALYCLSPGKLCNTTMQFGPLIKLLTGMGYITGFNLRGAPYDWRYGPETWAAPGRDFDQLKALIEETYSTNGDMPVHLVSISMGGPYGNAFLLHHVDQEWKDKYIKSFIPLASPWNGSPMVVHQLVSGFSWVKVPWMKPADFMKLCRTFTSLPWLAPFNLGEYDPIIVTTAERAYKLSEIADLFADAGAKVAAFFRPKARSHTAQGHPNVTVHCHYSYNVTTEASYSYPDGFASNPTVTYGDGDGTVDIASLAICEQWQAVPNSKPVEVVKTPNLGHVEILSDAATLASIATTVTGGSAFVLE